jgi:NitT/TauT family transport system substrate-binding protein
MRPWLSLALASFLCVTGISAASGQSHILLRLGVIPSDFAAQVYYAKDMGFFAKAGVDVEITPIDNGPAGAAAVAGGALDISLMNVLSLAIAHEKGLPFAIVSPANIYSSDAPTAGLLSVTRASSIRVAKDLTGKIVAVGALNNITDISARAWIDQNGGDSHAVRFVEVPITAMAEALLSGRVDAAVLDQGVYPTIGKPGDPLRILAYAFNAIAPNFITGSWMASSNWIATHRDEARRFAAAMKEAAVWGNSHHHESAAILAKYLRRDVDAVEASTRVLYATTMTPLQIQPSIDAAAKYGVIHTAFPARELIGSVARQ